MPWQGLPNDEILSSAIAFRGIQTLRRSIARVRIRFAVRFFPSDLDRQIIEKAKEVHFKVTNTILAVISGLEAQRVVPSRRFCA